MKLSIVRNLLVLGALAVALLGGVTLARAESPRIAPEQKRQAQPKIQATAQPPEARFSGMRIETARPNAELYKRVDSYKQHLDGILGHLDKIKEGVSTNSVREVTGQACDALKQSGATLDAILKDRPALENEGQAILAYTADLQQRFVDIIKEIDDKTEALRKEPLDSPQAVENLVQAYQSMKQTAVRGKERSEPLRKLVLDSGRELRSVFVEIERWPAVFDVSVRLCETFQVMGDQAEYIEMVKSLSEARQSLAQIIKKVADVLDDISHTPIEPQQSTLKK